MRVALHSLLSAATKTDLGRVVVAPLGYYHLRFAQNAR
jgi:hypothetical protein